MEWKAYVELETCEKQEKVIFYVQEKEICGAEMKEISAVHKEIYLGMETEIYVLIVKEISSLDGAISSWQANELSLVNACEMARENVEEICAAFQKGWAVAKAIESVSWERQKAFEILAKQICSLTYDLPWKN